MKTEPWSDQEHTFLRTNYVALGPAACASALERSVYATMKRASKLQVKRKKPSARLERQIKKLLYEEGPKPATEIAAHLGIGSDRVRTILNELFEEGVITFHRKFVYNLNPIIPQKVRYWILLEDFVEDDNG